MLQRVFGVAKPIIGMVHLQQLVGQKGFGSMDFVVRAAVRDAIALEEGGINGICIENWEDDSNIPFINPAMAQCIEEAVAAVLDAVKIPVGVNILPNDYRVAFALAAKLPLKFCWLDVFVDKVRTDSTYGPGQDFRVEVELNDLKRCREKAPRTLLFASIHPKHYILLEPQRITTSAMQARNNGADALVITRATGMSPDLGTLKIVKDCVGELPVLLGSGLNAGNAKEMLSVADGAIVGTALKDRGFKRVIGARVRRLMRVVAEVRHENY